MRKMAINLRDLKEAAAFADCRCPASEPNMIKAREHIGRLADLCLDLLNHSFQHLQVIELAADRKGDQGRWDDVQATREYYFELQGAIVNGRARGV
jgi:hypothetical protein